VQAGVANRFQYDNGLAIAGVAFTFSDSDTSLFAAGGLDFEIERLLQLSIGARKDYSEDSDSLSGRIGLLISIN
jgi:hypothetical protein